MTDLPWMYPLLHTLTKITDARKVTEKAKEKERDANHSSPFERERERERVRESLLIFYTTI